MHEDDWKANSVLDALADIPRCPGCGSVGVWSLFRGGRVGRCMASYADCHIIYFRTDGSFIKMHGEKPEVGAWNRPKS